MVSAVCDVDVALAVDSDARRVLQRGAGGRMAIAAEPSRSVCRPGKDRKRQWTSRFCIWIARVVEPDDIVIGIGDVEASERIGRQPARMIEPDLECAGASRLISTKNRVEGRLWRSRGGRIGIGDPADPVIQSVCDVQDAPLVVPGQSVRRVELSLEQIGARGPVSKEAEFARPSQRRDLRLQLLVRLVDRGNRDVDLADAVSVGVRYIDVEGGDLEALHGHVADRDRVGTLQLGTAEVAAIAFRAQRPVAGKDLFGVADQQADDLVGRIGNEGVAADYGNRVWLLRHLGRLSSRRSAGVGAELGR